ncbi:hypothetical protein [Campylobacter rectus]|uniref:hypothetical protein n=1 Tax=Campylobacter rectus TaxID=203 RepID=UPI0028DC2A63|nr:hypothetical protein [Campylobacter rectus]
MPLLGSMDEVGNLGGVLDKNFDVYCGIDAFKKQRINGPVEAIKSMTSKTVISWTATSLFAATGKNRQTRQCRPRNLKRNTGRWNR